MTEGEWLTSAEPQVMLGFLRGGSSERKHRLFAVACCRRIWDLLTDERSRKAVELAEDAADHPIPPHTLDAASGEAEEAFEDAISPDEGSTAERREKTGAACTAASYASNSPAVLHADAVEVMRAAADATADSGAERAGQATLVRELWAYSLRTITLNPTWLTPTVTDLARAAYEERIMPSGELELDRLGVLSDALEEAGCADADVLNHLRSPGPHVRGCWALDLVLGKE